MKKPTTFLMLLLFVIACKEDKQVLKSKELSLAGEYVPQEKIPTRYAFDWKITYEVEANDTKIDFQYMVKPKASYYGMLMIRNKKDLTKNSITIIDFGRNKRLAIRNGKGGKFLRVKTMPEINDNVGQSISVERTDTKEIKGYTCQGYKINTSEGTSTLYITQDASFAFNKGFGQYSNKSLKEKRIDASIISELENGLMMEMSFSGNGNNASANASKMRIKEFNKKSFSVDLSDYKTIRK